MNKTRLVEHIFKLYDFIKRAFKKSPNNLMKLPDLPYSRILKGSQDRNVLSLLESAQKVIERKKKIIATQNIKIQSLEKQISDLKNSANTKDSQPVLHQSVSMISTEDRKCTESPKKVHMKTPRKETSSSQSSQEDKEGITTINCDLNMLQEDNEELKQENMELLFEINNITFQFEAEIEKLTMANKDLMAKLEQKTKCLSEALERNQTLEDNIRDLQRKIIVLEPEKPLKNEDESPNNLAIHHIKVEPKSGVTSECSQEDLENIKFGQQNINYRVKVNERKSLTSQESLEKNNRRSTNKVVNNLDALIANKEENNSLLKPQLVQRHRSYFSKKPLKIVKDSNDQIKELDELIQFIEYDISDRNSEEGSNATNKDSNSDFSFFGLSVCNDSSVIPPANVKKNRKHTNSGEFQDTDSEKDQSSIIQ